jgi:hypothetical protein
MQEFGQKNEYFARFLSKNLVIPIIFTTFAARKYGQDELLPFAI